MVLFLAIKMLFKKYGWIKLVCSLYIYSLLYKSQWNLLCVQVSKTDPSPKREMPTMILFNVVFALRVWKDIYFLLFLYDDPVQSASCGCVLFIGAFWNKRAVCIPVIIFRYTLSVSTYEHRGRRGHFTVLYHAPHHSSAVPAHAVSPYPVSSSIVQNGWEVLSHTLSKITVYPLWVSLP